MMRHISVWEIEREDSFVSVMKNAIGARATSRCTAIAIALQLVLAGQAGSVNASATILPGRGPVRIVENYPERPSVLVLNNGQRLQTMLYKVRVLGTLKTEGKVPFIVMAGRGCIDCDEHTSIYIYSPSDGPMGNEAEQRRWVYPGRVVSNEDGTTPLYEGRMFIGDCLPGYDDAVLWYLHERTDDGKWESSVLVVSVRADTLAEVRLKKGFPPLSQVLQRVAVGKCREVTAINRESEP